MQEKFRYPYDRRAGFDRRMPTWGEEIPETGADRRSGKEQRSLDERRRGWARVDEWSSVWSELHGDRDGPTE